MLLLLPHSLISIDSLQIFSFLILLVRLSSPSNISAFSVFLYFTSLLTLIYVNKFLPSICAYLPHSFYLLVFPSFSLPNLSQLLFFFHSSLPPSPAPVPTLVVSSLSSLHISLLLCLTLPPSLPLSSQPISQSPSPLFFPFCSSVLPPTLTSSLSLPLGLPSPFLLHPSALPSFPFKCIHPLETSL